MPSGEHALPVVTGQQRTLPIIRNKPDRKRLEHNFMEENIQYKAFGAPPQFEDGGIRAGVKS